MQILYEKEFLGKKRKKEKEKTGTSALNKTNGLQWWRHGNQSTVNFVNLSFTIRILLKNILLIFSKFNKLKK